jgi:hypothetical protein
MTGVDKYVRSKKESCMFQSANQRTSRRIRMKKIENKHINQEKSSHTNKIP